MIRTKIIATVGPATESSRRIGELIDAGVDVFRLNFSHGTLEGHGRVLERIRQTAGQNGATVAVMADLCGPKIRVDPVEDDGFEIKPGDRLDIVRDHVVGNAERISTSRPELVREAALDHRILIDDGAVRLRVQEAAGDRLRCVCEVGGRIASRKGLNLPDSDLAMPALTEKDRQDLAWAVEHGVDYLALSFVRSAEDLQILRSLLPGDGSGCGVVAKIETAQAVSRLDEIIDGADVVLVARGDMGVEMDLTQVPLVQKEIAVKCQRAGTPVIIATQMLQSMVQQPTAPRAEVSDVANAILDAADCVMLSAETSVGRYPIESVRMMNEIARRTEAFLAQTKAAASVQARALRWPVTTAVAHGTSLLAEELDAKLAAVWTETGNTARLISKCRLNRPIVGLSPDERVCRRMAMYYGVLPARLDRRPDTAEMLADVDRMLRQRGLAQAGDTIVVSAGAHVEQPAATSSLFVHVVGGN